MFSFAAYPYPKSESFKEIFVSSLGAGIAVYLFLIIFQPFGTENFQHPYKFVLLFPYCIIFGMAFLMANLTTSRFSNWNIGSELLKITLILFLGSVLSYFYNSLFLSHVKLDIVNYFYMFLYTLAVGIPISIIYILSRYIYLKNIHEKKARDISQHLPVSASEQRQNLLKITAQNTELIINENDFLFVQSMENYCTFYFLENNSLQKALIRISLANVLQQIETGSVKKCHRSYIVNLGRVKKIKGNAQGYKLILPEIDFEIPVSRSFIPSIIPQLQQQNL
ncbi:LytTR family DNA-binding domain-containing protein [Chryseobacterium sp. WLY505]|uniref:LytTR family DNA-binding domain-containing protein n=1 Tax=Chryseobacterium sp. WLY505 TaxID=3068892 RepID=UPI002796679D|nr:LytTR family DNA-binding domain-containing protein [Chryseobacterium sp. WLY505]MDQ1857374.1 LytTR family DNA-binding domain-containing protein [Chryseobacterium sp. WLY505]